MFYIINKQRVIAGEIYMGDSLEILPKTVRSLLNIDNDGIIELCKAGDIPLRQNEHGLTYFTTDDVITLKKLQKIQTETNHKEEKSIKLKNTLKKLPAKKQEQKNISTHQINNDNESVLLLKQITSAVKNIENGFYDKFSSILENKLEYKLEEKLAGLDEVIMDLVKSKSEVEQLRKTIADNTKEIYSLKNELSRYKQVFGKFYVKNEPDDEFNIFND